MTQKQRRRQRKNILQKGDPYLVRDRLKDHQREKDTVQYLKIGKDTVPYPKIGKDTVQDHVTTKNLRNQEIVPGQEKKNLSNHTAGMKIKVIAGGPGKDMFMRGKDLVQGTDRIIIASKDHVLAIAIEDNISIRLKTFQK